MRVLRNPLHVLQTRWDCRSRLAGENGAYCVLPEPARDYGLGVHFPTAGDEGGLPLPPAAAGMVISTEPGVGDGNLSLLWEDVHVVTEDGHEQLTLESDELMEIPF